MNFWVVVIFIVVLWIIVRVVVRVIDRNEKNFLYEEQERQNIQKITSSELANDLHNILNMEREAISSVIIYPDYIGIWSIAGKELFSHSNKKNGNREFYNREMSIIADLCYNVLDHNVFSPPKYYFTSYDRGNYVTHNSKDAPYEGRMTHIEIDNKPISVKDKDPFAI